MSERPVRLNEDRPMGGARLALTTCQETPNTSIFMKYLNMFIQVAKFSPGMAPFANKNFGPKWFKDPFPDSSPQTAAQSNMIWRAFLTPTLLSYKIKPGSKCGCFHELPTEPRGSSIWLKPDGPEASSIS